MFALSADWTELPHARVRARVEDRVAWLVMQNPPANNYSYEMMRDLDEAILAARTGMVADNVRRLQRIVDEADLGHVLRESPVAGQGHHRTTGKFAVGFLCRRPRSQSRRLFSGSRLSSRIGWGFTGSSSFGVNSMLVGSGLSRSSVGDCRTTGRRSSIAVFR